MATRNPALLDDATATRDSTATRDLPEARRRLAGTPAAPARHPSVRRWLRPPGTLEQALRGLDDPGITAPAISPIELFYDSIAEEFDRIMNRYDLQRRLETVYDELLGGCDLRGRSLLDAGCGTGWFSLWAHQRGADVTAVDIGPRLLSQVRRKCPARTVLGDVLDLQFPDGSFDIVVSSECIEHTRDPRRAVHEVMRVCRPGGLAVITSNNRRWWWLCNLANRLHLRPYEGIENWPSWRQLRGWVEGTGATVLDMRGIHLFPFQIALFHPLLRFLDRWGRGLGPFCVNQAVLATRTA